MKKNMIIGCIAVLIVAAIVGYAAWYNGQKAEEKQAKLEMCQLKARQDYVSTIRAVCNSEVKDGEENNCGKVTFELAESIYRVDVIQNGKNANTEAQRLHTMYQEDLDTCSGDAM